MHCASGESPKKPSKWCDALARHGDPFGVVYDDEIERSLPSPLAGDQAPDRCKYGDARTIAWRGHCLLIPPIVHVPGHKEIVAARDAGLINDVASKLV
jgi:hypothetical protein